MNAANLLAELESLGVKVSADGERLRVNAAAGRLSAQLKQQIATNKLQLLQLVAARSAGPLGEYPVSFAQRRLWFLDRLEPGNMAYHLGASHDIESAVNVPAMRAAINDVRKRQSALRTVLREVDGEPVQVVLPFEPASLEVIDLSALPQAEHDAALGMHTHHAAAQPFDLAAGPLFRASLLRLESTRYRLLFSFHHVICDGWSLGLFIADLHAAYAARQAGVTPEFRPLAIHFAEHAARERTALSGAALPPLLEYWRGRLASASPTLALPTDRPRPQQRGFGGDAHHFALPTSSADGLRDLARSERATLYMTLLALFKILLYRYSGQSDIVVGTPVANRNNTELENVIGMFVGTLPIRSDLSPDLTMRTLIAQIRENLLQAHAHNALPFEKMVDEIRPERTLAWSPIFQALFTLQNTPLASTYAVTTVASMVDLSMFMWDESGGIRGTLEYNTALFDAATAKRMCEQFAMLAQGAVQAPDQSIARLAMLTPAQREQILIGWNNTARPYPCTANLSELFDAVARRQPLAVALESTVLQPGDTAPTRLSYAELANASERIARRLREQGARPGDVIGLYVERSIGAVVALLAILRVGAAYLPLDPNDPAVRVSAILREASVGIVLGQRSLMDRLPSLANLRRLALEQLWQVEDSTSAEPTDPGLASGDSLAYVMFTSGTTGVPKGVCVTHRNVARLVCNPDYLQLGPEETLLQFAPASFDASTLEIWGALLNGARLVVPPGHAHTAAELARVLNTHGVTILWLTAGFFHHMVDSELGALASVRQVLAGGDVLSVAHVQRLLDAKTAGTVVNGYGPTENTTFTCCYVMSPGLKLASTVPIGRPIANTQVYVLDPFGEPVPPGIFGELFAGGDGVARGYLGVPAIGNDRFLPDPFADRAGARMYRTGDLARWRADGILEFQGRSDRQVKVRGFRVELQEIEDALRLCAQLRDVAVIARPDATASNTLIAYLVPAADCNIDITTVRQSLAERLPSYMGPSAFVVLPALPLTANGKLDRNALPPPTFDPVVTTPANEPRTLVESQLHAIWEHILGRSGIGIHDNFFELGGHSLMAVRMFAQIERVFGMRLPVSALFQAPDIASLAHRLKDEGFTSPWSSLVVIQPEGSKRPLFMVPGIGGNVLCFSDLARHLGPDQPLFGMQALGLDDRSQPIERIEPMAAHYLAEILKVQATGPYRIGGTCFGGVVAYEMAQQLRAAGQTVELLFLLESWPRQQQSVATALRLWSYQFAFLLAATRRNIIGFCRLPLRRWPRAVASALKIVAEMAATRDIYRGDRARMYVDRVSLANQRALLRYRPRAYVGALHCAFSAQRSFTGEDTRRSWRTLAPHDYTQADLPAIDSGQMLLPPCVATLAAWMQSMTDRVDQRAQRHATTR